MTVKARLRHYYESNAPEAQTFRYGLLAFDLVTIGFLVITSFFPHTALVEAIDVVIGIIIALEFAIRLWLAPSKLRHMVRPVVIADFIAVLSFLAPIAGEGLGFLRVMRMLRLLHTYQMMEQLREDFRFVREHDEIIVAAVNLIVFLFIMTGLIYATQWQHNPDITNYADALYFTVTTLTTTGFGDITLHGTWGRLISVTVMIFGVTLFLRLAQVMFRPPKVRHACPRCGLILHDPDAVHCKHCGKTLRIQTEGDI